MKHNLTALLLLCSTMVYAQDFEVDGIYYNIIDKKAKKVEVTIGEKEYAGDIIIPETIVYKKKKYTVASLGRYPEEESVTTRINDSTFIMTIPKVGLFEHNDKLTSITLPNSIEIIGTLTFFDCDNLKSIKIPKSIRSIASDAFQNCPSLEYITVDEGNTVYDSRNNCNAIIQTDKNLLLVGSNKTIIPDGIKIIGNYAFSERIGITDIKIPNSVKIIGYAAFDGCKNLTSIEIPQTTNISGSIIEDCNNLKSIKIGDETLTKEEFEARFSEPKVETIFDAVAEVPGFPGGMTALLNYLKKNMQYPNECKENYIQGKAYVNFVVNTDGTLDNIKISKSSGNEALDKEAIRLVKAMPNWIPGKQSDGKVVRASFTLPVVFRL